MSSRTASVASALVACACVVGCADPATEARMRGNVHMRAGEAAKALEAYDEAVAKKPGDAETQLLRANALQELGRTDEALAGYQAAKEGAHASSEVGVKARRELAILLFHRGKAEEAKHLLREVLGVRRDDVFALNRLAEVHVSLGEGDEAGALIEAVLRRDPKNVAARLTRVRHATATKNWEGAAAALTELRGLRPGAAFVEYEQAVVDAARGETQAALSALGAALKGADAKAKAKAKADPRLAALATDPGFLALTGAGQ